MTRPRFCVPPLEAGWRRVRVVPSWCGSSSFRCPCRSPPSIPASPGLSARSRQLPPRVSDAAVGTDAKDQIRRVNPTGVPSCNIVRRPLRADSGNGREQPSNPRAFAHASVSGSQPMPGFYPNALRHRHPNRRRPRHSRVADPPLSLLEKRGCAAIPDETRGSGVPANNPGIRAAFGQIAA